MKVLFLVFMMLLCPLLLFGGDTYVQAEKELSVFTMSLLPSQIEFNPLYTYSSLEGQVYSALYEGVVGYDPQSLSPVSALASRWEVLEDGTLYRFHINPQAYYSNGDKVLSKHFRDTWLKMLTLGDEAPFSFLLDPVLNASKYRRGEVQDGVGITAPEEDVLEVRLEYSVSHFLSILAHQSLVVIHPDILNVRDWDRVEDFPVTGPYYVLKKDSDGIEFARNEFYWDTEYPKFDRLVLNFSDNAPEATQAFNADEIQWIYSGFESSELQVPGSLQINPQFSTSYYFFSAKQKPFDDERVRRALHMLLPLNEIRSETVHFFPSSVLIPQFPGYPEVTGIQEQDTPAALELLEEAGYPEGQGLPVIQIILSDGPEAQRVGTIMKENWEKLSNITVELSYHDYYDYQTILKDSDFTVGSLSWIGDYADPMTFLQLWRSDNTLNYSNYFDSSFDLLLQESNGLEGVSRYEVLAKAEDYLLKNAIILPVSHSPSFHVIDLDRIGGWYATPLDVHPYKYLYRKKLLPPPNIADSGLFIFDIHKNYR